MDSLSVAFNDGQEFSVSTLVFHFCKREKQSKRRISPLAIPVRAKEKIMKSKGLLVALLFPVFLLGGIAVNPVFAQEKKVEKI